ncbi:hypothetical protein T484DRAFT_2016457 [Baffinella frigidus]|nr:hypothetical protein T484DRAFT_2016457 [Cryptophyta sp. CCMP2293]
MDAFSPLKRTKAVMQVSPGAFRVLRVVHHTFNQPGAERTLQETGAQPTRITILPSPLSLGEAAPTPAPPQAGCAESKSWKMIGHSAVTIAWDLAACEHVLRQPPSPPHALAGPQPPVNSSNPEESSEKMMFFTAAESHRRVDLGEERSGPVAPTQSLVMVNPGFCDAVKAPHPRPAEAFSPERLLGRDVQPRVGMTVKLTQQAIERRQETGRMDPSKGGVGKICKVHPNWTADVIWENTNRVRCGYACGTAAGKVRAFHLKMVNDEFGDRPETEWNRCKTGVIPSRAPYV